jgi:hypothetical protein
MDSNKNSLKSKTVISASIIASIYIMFPENNPKSWEWFDICQSPSIKAMLELSTRLYSLLSIAYFFRGGDKVGD